MQVKDIWEEAKEAAGLCSDTIMYRTLTRAVELLANEGLFDPMIGTVDFYVEGGYYVALPRDVKTPIRVNINNNPSFVRSRLYEYQANTDGSNDEEELGWMWHDKGYSPIQDEQKLPSKLRYQVTDAADEGKTCTVIGTDSDGRRIKNVLVGTLADMEEGENTFQEILSVTREETVGEALLVAEDGAVARYYGDETHPEYRVIKLSQTGVAVRMIYRKHVFKLTSQEDIIPLHSAMAVIRAVEAVRLMLKSKYADAQAVLMEATRFLTKEQDTRDEAQTLAVNLEITNAINQNISTNEVLIVADIYDLACDILGPMGRQKVFDRINDAIEVLQNKSKWDSTTGWCDIWKDDHCPTNTTTNRCGDGYFVLPRYIRAIESLNFCGRPMIPRNRWYEFHVNGNGSMPRSSAGTWDDIGDTVIINSLRTLEGRIVPIKCIAVPEDARDDDLVIRIFGIERLEDDSEVEVWRDSEKGWLCPCKSSAFTLPEDAPNFVRFDRIKRNKQSKGFIRLIEDPDSDGDLLLGYWYPDELEPTYRLIKVPSCKSQKVRVRYRKRTAKISGLNDIINLRSRIALELALRAVAVRGKDLSLSVALETQAAQYLLDEQVASNPIQQGGLQIAPGSIAALTENIS